MKDRTCFAEEINFTSTEFDDDLMECDVFCELVKGLDQEVVFDMAQRLTNILGQQEPPPADEDEEEEEEEDEYDDSAASAERLQTNWAGAADEDPLCGLRDRSLLLAGYTECMDEAIRYLVEEEQYSAEHPLVLGLRQHLVDEQERVLGAAQQLDNAHHQQHQHHHHDDNNNGGGDPDVSLVALLAGTILNVRQPTL